MELGCASCLLFTLLSTAAGFTCPANCQNSCGSGARDCSSGGSCTPFSILPHRDSQNCESWMDGYDKWNTSAFFRYSSHRSYQCWRASQSDDVWVMHGCDGSGVQTDCRGDILYLEHFAQPSSVHAAACPTHPYPSHSSCPFNHSGQPDGILSFGEYICGWWRGYNRAYDADLARSAYDARLFGAAGSGADYSAALERAMQNCPSCSNGNALETPFTGEPPCPKPYPETFDPHFDPRAPGA